ncbi:Mitochondrial phosphate carrier protein [Madurella fahalii]|uniref:Mitochondrial phosphate carrier protein n=1 Tax=Madurella fahalii TaxID=1157608 RepID=A0ABQ0GD87_9PEZI
MVFVTRAISLTNFIVASSALGFQVCVLYPWHNRLDEDFEALKKEHLRVLESIKGTAAGAAHPGPGASTAAAAAAPSAEKSKGILGSLGGFAGWSINGPPSPSSSSSLVAAVQAVPQGAIFQPSSSSIATDSSLPDLSPITMYSRYALAGAVCCSFTHAILTPIDIIKTRIQLDPQSYNRGIVGGLRWVVAGEGAGALALGLGPTVAGYFLQGGFKFGGYEFLKASAIDALGYDAASANRYAVYLGSSALAEIAGDLALCPFEAVRIRLVSQPGFARGLWDGLARMAGEEGVHGLYSGLGPILMKQVPYTMASFVVYENTLEQIYKHVDKSAVSGTAITGINIASGLIAGVAAAVVSQPADTLLSKINKDKGATGESTFGRLLRLARGMGVRGSFAGIRARIIMVGGMTAVQFAIYGDIKKALGATSGIEIK